MEKIWIRAGLDLKMITYDCVATGLDQGWQIEHLYLLQSRYYEITQVQ